jgi:hypothetical protein
VAGYRSGELTPSDVKRLLELELQEEGEELDSRLWESLVELGHVDDVQQGEMSIRELAAKHGEFCTVLKAQGVRRPRQREAHDLPPDARLDVLSDILSERAAQEPGVLAFRESILGGSLLAWDDVDAWIKAQGKKDGPATQYLSVAVPDGYQLRQAETGLILTEPPLTVSQEAAGWDVKTRLLEYGVPDDPWTRRVPTKVRGVLDELRTLSEHLAKSYGWQPSQASVFVLTGLPVQLSRGRVTISHRFPYKMTGRLTLELDPRVSPREVLALYRKHRRELLGGTYKPMDRKHLELARFYEARKKGTWQERMAEWNGQQRESAWHYTDWRNFRRDCVQAWERLFEEEGHQ